MNKRAVTTIHLEPGDLLAEGFFFRLNRAALEHAPIIYLIRNTGEANGVPLPMAFANPCLIDLAPAFRIRGARVHASTLEATLQRAHDVCERGHGPFLIELLTTEEEAS